MSWFSRFLENIGIRRKSIQIREDPRIDIFGSSDDYSLASIKPQHVSHAFSDKQIKSRGLSYFVSQGSQSSWINPQYDHIEVELLYDVESLFARATRAKLTLFRREGFEFIGYDDARVNYVRSRISQIERASGIPFAILLEHTARDLFVHSNAFWLKVRNTKASGGKVRRDDGASVKPIAGLFSLPPETMIPEIDSNGNVLRWKQQIEGQERIFAARDILHFYTNKKVGYPLGVPTVIPAIDDIRALRSIEANIDVLLHKHLFPIVVWKVGTEDVPPQTFEDNTTELDVVRQAVANMPSEGSLVVPNRLEVEAIGAESKALRAEEYLQYFKQRLYAGFDVSSIDMGSGNSSSRSTAQTLSRNLVDTVKKVQYTVEDLGQFFINELLMESTFPKESLFKDEYQVRIRFNEIDKESKMSEENHAVDLFHKNAITFPEARAAIGKDPLKDGEEDELWYYKFGREMALIQAVDESSGKGAAPPNENEAVSNKDKPANQHGPRSSPKLNKDSRWLPESIKNPIYTWYKSLQVDLQRRWATNPAEFDLGIAKQDIISTFVLIEKDFLPLLKRVIRENYPNPDDLGALSREAAQRASKFLTRLRDHLIERLEKEILAGHSPAVSFKALEYRTELIFDTELAFIGNLARFKWFEKSRIPSRIISNGSPCPECKVKLTLINENDKLSEDQLPPFHPKCDCRIVEKDEDR